jgi:hypothetical protein
VTVSEGLKGCHADYTSGSPDILAVTSLMTMLGGIRCPYEPVKHAPHRWRGYVDDPRDLDWLDGDRLLHTDWNPSNVLITGGRGLLIDWAWPTRGAGWIDQACLIIRLIAAGHTPPSAENVVHDVPAWQEAACEGLAAFAEACARIWQEIADADFADWTQHMARAAHKWQRHRLTGPRIGP